MKKMISTLGLSRDDWLKYRKQGIGGSDAGAVCGLNPYRSPISVFYDKTSDVVEEKDSEAMRQGREFEQYVADRFCEATGKKVRRANAMFCHDEHGFMLADVDRMVVGENAGLECKTASPYVADQWADGNIPLSYQVQCYHYMAVMNTDAWYIAVLIYGRDFKYYRMERDPALEADLIHIEKQFWEEHILKKVIPEPDGSDAAEEVIKRHYRDSLDISIPLVGFDEKLRRRQELMESIERMDTEKKKIEQELKLFLGEAQTAEDDRYRVTWKPYTRSQIDTERLKAENPMIYDRYLKSAVTRRLMIKAA